MRLLTFLCLLFFSTFSSGQNSTEFIGNEFRLINSSDYQIIRTNMQGEIIWIHDIDNNAHIDTAESFYIVYGKTEVKGGRITSSPHDYDYWIIPRQEFPLAEVYPNPTSGILNIYTNLLNETRILIYDSSNRIVYRDRLVNYFTTVDISFMQPSIYFYRIFEGSNTIKTGKICVL